MKLSITQIILCVLLVAAASYTAWWIFSQVPKEEVIPIMTGSLTGMSSQNITVIDEYHPVENESFFFFIRSIAIITAFLGIVPLITNTLVMTRRISYTRKMLIINMLAGALVIVFSVLIIKYGFSPEYDYSYVSKIIQKTIEIDPNMFKHYQGLDRPIYGIRSAGFACFFGTTEIIISAIQFLKSRKKVAVAQGA